MNRIIAQKIKDFSLDMYEPIMPRELSLGEIPVPKAGNLVTVIVGMRRSGKTYRLFQEMQKIYERDIPREFVLYFNFEDDRFKPLTPQIGDEVLATFYEMNPDALEQGAYFFFDEIQEMEDWEIWLRRIVDTRKATIYVTGSSSKLLSGDVASAFRGRSIDYEMLPFSFREYVHYHNPEVTEKDSVWGTADEVRLKKLFEQYLTQGGFPGVQDETDQRLIMILQSYAQLTVAQDVVERHNLSNPRAVSLFAQRLLSMSGRELSLRKIENDFRSQGIVISRSALSDALRYFEDAFLLTTVKRFSRTFADNARSTSKIYAIDTGLAYANSLSPTQDIGQRLETVVYLELRRRSLGGRLGAIASLRTDKHGYEIDFVVGDALAQEGFELYQVSLSVSDEKTRVREIRALQEAMLERKLTRSYLLTLEGPDCEITVPEGMIYQRSVWSWCLD